MTSPNWYGFKENPATPKQIDANITLYKAICEKFHFRVRACARCPTYWPRD